MDNCALARVYSSLTRGPREVRVDPDGRDLGAVEDLGGGAAKIEQALTWATLSDRNLCGLAVHAFLFIYL